MSHRFNNRTVKTISNAAGGRPVNLRRKQNAAFKQKKKKSLQLVGKPVIAAGAVGKAVGVDLRTGDLEIEFGFKRTIQTFNPDAVEIYVPKK